MDQIVSVSEIREKAVQAADQGLRLNDCNPYPEGSDAHARFEIYFWARERELNGEAYA